MFLDIVWFVFDCTSNIFKRTRLTSSWAWIQVCRNILTRKSPEGAWIRAMHGKLGANILVWCQCLGCILLLAVLANIWSKGAVAAYMRIQIFSGKFCSTSIGALHLCVSTSASQFKMRFHIAQFTTPWAALCFVGAIYLLLVYFAFEISVWDMLEPWTFSSAMWAALSAMFAKPLLQAFCAVVLSTTDS